MDLINDAPLNQAHKFSRLADHLSQRGDFDEACEHHEKAACCLVEALKLTNNSLALESLELQRQYHIKKQEILRLKKKHILAIKEAVRVQKEIMSRVPKVSKKNVAGENDGSLQKAIYRTFEEADSLLELLVQKKGEASEKTETVPALPGALGNRKPKDDSVVIEELKIVNYQLRSLITQLMTELANSERQVTVLQKRIVELETLGPRLAPNVTTTQSGATAPSEPVESSSAFPTAEELVVYLPPLDLPLFENPK